jgi:D-alanyl-D-alanine carboxypeptidase/D-alanyl-D-alanine-endopeptidase (penicillin-binding protein 4)
MPRARLVRSIAAAAVCAAALALAGSAQAAPLPGAQAAQIQSIISGPRYPNATWGISVTDAATGERVYALNPQQMFVTGSITKIFQGVAALESYGPDYRFRTPVHRIGRVEDGRLRGTLSLVASGDFSFGLRDRPGGRLAYADGGADHNEANSLGFVDRVTGNPLKALTELARDVRASGITRASDVVIDDRLFETYTGWPDGEITPIWVNENLIDITLRPTARGSAARYDWRPKTAAYRVVSRVRTGAATNLEVDSPRPGIVRVQGTIEAGSGPTVRTYLVDDAQAFARTAFIQALEGAGVGIDAATTGDNPTDRLPRSRRYPTGTRLGQWVSPEFSEYVKVVEKVSYNRGADLLACLVGARVGRRDCLDGLGRATEIVRGLGVPGTQFNNFDGAGSDDRNKHVPDALNTLNRVAASQPWGSIYRASLPQLGVPGGGDIGTFGTASPARGKLQAKTGTRAGGAPGAPAGILTARGLSGYLAGASGRQYLITVVVNDVSLGSFDVILDVIQDQVRIVEAVYAGT